MTDPIFWKIYLERFCFFRYRDAADSVPSFVVCEDLLTIGRMSFKNFNPAVDVGSLFHKQKGVTGRWFSLHTVIDLS